MPLPSNTAFSQFHNFCALIYHHHCELADYDGHIQDHEVHPTLKIVPPWRLLSRPK
jgi:hypothetical protein